jgi:hypothetical protein
VISGSNGAEWLRLLFSFWLPTCSLGAPSVTQFFGAFIGSPRLRQDSFETEGRYTYQRSAPKIALGGFPTGAIKLVSQFGHNAIEPVSDHFAYEMHFAARDLNALCSSPGPAPTGFHIIELAVNRIA